MCVHVYVHLCTCERLRKYAWLCTHALVRAHYCMCMNAWTCHRLCMHVYKQVLKIKCNRKEAQVLWCQRGKEVIEIRFMEKKLCNNFKLTQIPWGLEDTYLKPGIVLLPKSGYHLRCTKKSKHKDTDRYNHIKNPHFWKKVFFVHWKLLSGVWLQREDGRILILDFLSSILPQKDGLRQIGCFLD